MGDASDNALGRSLGVVVVWFDANRFVMDVFGVYQLRPAGFAPAEAGARAHLHDASRRSGQIASVLGQVGAMDVGGCGRYINAQMQLQLVTAITVDNQSQCFASFCRSTLAIRRVACAFFDIRTATGRARNKSAYRKTRL